jgi:uncharacterized membrane protein YciS (DUF1049 family)
MTETPCCRILFLQIILGFILLPVAFALGLVVGVIISPFYLIIGLPAFIIKEIKSKKDIKKAAQERLNQYFEEAKQLQIKINEIERNDNQFPL